MRAFGGSLVCGLGMTLLVGGSVWGIERRVPGWLVGEASAAEPAVEAPKQASGKAEEAAAPSRPSVEPAELEAADAVDPAGPMMPDLGRERVDRAMRRMRGLGVRLRVSDDYGNPIDRESGSGYRLRPSSVSVEPGTALEPGQVVRARAYALASSFAGGY